MPLNIQRDVPAETEFWCFRDGMAIELPITADVQDKAFLSEIRAFVDGIRSGVSPLPIDHSIAVMRLIHQICSETEAER